MDFSSPGSRLLGDLMTAATKRAEVLGQNVANQNTPGYIRKDVVFESELAKAIERGKSLEDLEELELKVVEDDERPARADGNNVSVEEELSLARENRLLFEVYASIRSGRGSMLRNAITGQR